MSTYPVEFSRLEEENKKLKTENEQLREVLKKAKDWADDSAWGGREEIVNMINQALNDKPLTPKP